VDPFGLHPPPCELKKIPVKYELNFVSGEEGSKFLYITEKEFYL
jgi:hypothetical protein